ncbi:hypothetical protein B0H10DRAFT_1959407 [Mycena sp. CBHHK59/15]|nr:hypothetical protein B0H10DRAFT_1959407 [Mycena sp. CBHHK59/15]
MRQAVNHQKMEMVHQFAYPQATNKVQVSPVEASCRFFALVFPLKGMPFWDWHAWQTPFPGPTHRSVTPAYHKGFEVGTPSSDWVFGQYTRAKEAQGGTKGALATNDRYGLDIEVLRFWIRVHRQVVGRRVAGQTPKSEADVREMEASVGWHGDATWRRGNANVTCNAAGIESVEAAEMWEAQWMYNLFQLFHGFVEVSSVGTRVGECQKPSACIQPISLLKIADPTVVILLIERLRDVSKPSNQTTTFQLVLVSAIFVLYRPLDIGCNPRGK